MSVRNKADYFETKKRTKGWIQSNTEYKDAYKIYAADEGEMLNSLNYRNCLEMIKDFVIDGKYSNNGNKVGRHKKFVQEGLIHRARIGDHKTLRYVLTDLAKKELGLMDDGKKEI